MRTGRPKQALILTEEERERLQSLAHRARSQALLARRARVVLACGEGLDNQAVAKKLRCSLGMVSTQRSASFKSCADCQRSGVTSACASPRSDSTAA